MATQIITFPGQLNVSIQPTDILYATLLTSGQSGRNHSRGDEKPVAVGEVKTVSHAQGKITVDDSGYPSITLTVNHYLFFCQIKFLFYEN